MFDEQVSGANVAATLSLASTTHCLARQQECKLLELAAHWQTFITPTAKHPPRKRCQALNRVGSWAATARRRCWSSASPNWAPALKPATDQPAPQWPMRWICGTAYPNFGS